MQPYFWIGYVSGWRIDLPRHPPDLPHLDSFFVLLDRLYPESEPRIAAPNAPADYSWPHVEDRGLLCLEKLQRSDSPVERVLKAYNNALHLFWFDKATQEREFAREFRAYWNRSKSAKAWPFLSLVTPGLGSRNVAYFRDLKRRQYVFADSKVALKDWLRNRGDNPADRELGVTFLGELTTHLAPPDFPKIGRDLIKHFPPGTLEESLVAGIDFPILIEAKTETGPIYIGTVFQSPPEKTLIKGFRSVSKIPKQIVLNAFGSAPILRCQVDRLDASWIHSRDHDRNTLEKLQAKRVAIIGCGALGASIARLLVQAGVAHLLFVDHDSFEGPNASRHLLGISWMGWNKAEATATALQRDFPHIAPPRIFKQRAHSLSRTELEELSKSDLIVTAGIDLIGEVALDRWRLAAKNQLALLSVWSEEFAVAGHAVLVWGPTSLLDLFDSEGIPQIAVTDWPKGGTLVIEAGCGNVFQPHGAVDLNDVITLGARAAIDFLSGRQSKPFRRAYLGDRQRAIELGGVPRSEFDASFLTRQFPL